MALTSFLPDSPERLSTIESWPYLAISFFGILTAVSGYVVVQVRSYRATIEKDYLEKQLAKSDQALSATKVELDEARKSAEAARIDAEQLRQQLRPRDVSPEQHRTIVSGLRTLKGKVEIFYPADVETQVFAKRLAAVIREAG